jgi:hypothetical protein
MERTAREIASTQKILKSSGIEAGMMLFENK